MTGSHNGGRQLAPTMRQRFTQETHQEQVCVINEARIAVFLERASAAAYEVVEAHKQGVVGHAMDRLKAQRDHWISQAQEAKK